MTTSLSLSVLRNSSLVFMLFFVARLHQHREAGNEPSSSKRARQARRVKPR
jgi:hypothetical protein